MLQAIASRSSLANAYGGAPPSPVSLQAQLQRYQQQLSDCVNCASASTPQGKADIQAISARISQVRERIAQVDVARNPAQAAAVPAPDGPKAPDRPAAGALQGSLIDVFA